ncbi:MAG: glutathione S-transferase N-terminal domain-containing protein [Burkholderiaceae bacterium]|jgi:glutathione S-transferase|nr:glutathione S-transferase N-terminal domain-containing protein [Burkholderiaceae bacterium]
MPAFTLYCFAQSGNAYKAALMLNLCGADWAPRFVDFFNGETRTPAYREINVMGEVPVLEHDGRRLSQSGVILDYLASRLGRFGWRDDDERREILRWILFDNHKLTSYVATLRFMLQFARTGETPVTEWLRGRANSALKVLDAHLSGRRFAVGDAPTIADLSMCGYLYWFDEFGIDQGTFPAVGAWLQRIRALPGWVHPYELMPGHPLPGR